MEVIATDIRSNPSGGERFRSVAFELSALLQALAKATVDIR
jgi:hypothetical protein